MRFDQPPEKGVVGIDLDQAFFWLADLLGLVERFDDAGNRGAGEAEKDDLLRGLQRFGDKLPGFQNRDCRLA